MDDLPTPEPEQPPPESADVTSLLQRAALQEQVATRLPAGWSATAAGAAALAGLARVSAAALAVPEPLTFALPGELSALSAAQQVRSCALLLVIFSSQLVCSLLIRNNLLQERLSGSVRNRLPKGTVERIDLSAGSVIVTVHWKPGVAVTREGKHAQPQISDSDLSAACCGHL